MTLVNDTFSRSCCEALVHLSWYVYNSFPDFSLHSTYVPVHARGTSHIGSDDIDFCRLRCLNLSTLEFRRQRSNLIQTFKIPKGLDKVNSKHWFKILKGLDKANYKRQCSTCGNYFFKTTLSRTTRGHSHKHPGATLNGSKEVFFHSKGDQGMEPVLSIHSRYVDRCPI